MIIEGKPAARCGDVVICSGVGTLALIVTGSASVMVQGNRAAVVGSMCAHATEAAAGAGVVTSGASTVFCGDDMAGATFGDQTAAKKACEKALATRARRLSRAAPPHDQVQAYLMNCGLETARQLCQQKCDAAVKQGIANAKACDACKKTEQEFYRDFLLQWRDQKKLDNQKKRRENEEIWAQFKASGQKLYALRDPYWERAERPQSWDVAKDMPYSGKTDDPNVLDRNGEPRHPMQSVSTLRDPPDQNQQAWDDYAKTFGNSFVVWVNRPRYVEVNPLPRSWEGAPICANVGRPDGPPLGIQSLGNEVDDGKLPGPPTPIGGDSPQDPKVGSTAEERRQLLKEWCDVDSQMNPNDSVAIGQDLAQGNVVVATVDVEALDFGREQGNPPARHTVTVTQMNWNEKGELETVFVNDPADRNGKACGKPVGGALFSKALVPASSLGSPVWTNTVPNV